MFEKLFLKNPIYSKVQLLGRPAVHSSLFEQLVGGPACVSMCREVQASAQSRVSFLGVIHLTCWDLPTRLSWWPANCRDFLSFPSSVGIRSGSQCTQLPHVFWGWNAGPPVCTASTFLTESSLQNSIWVLIGYFMAPSSEGTKGKLGLALFLLTNKSWSRKKLIIAMFAIPNMSGFFQDPLGYWMCPYLSSSYKIQRQS